MENSFMHLRLQLGKDIWIFSPDDLGECPIVPLISYGELKSSRDPSRSLYYVLDNNYNIWLGLRKKKDIILEYFQSKLAMEVLYNYNVLSWIMVAELIPTEIYEQIRKD